MNAPDSFHRTLDAALARVNGGCACSDCATTPPVDTEAHDPRLEAEA